MGLTKATLYAIYALVYLARQPEDKFVPLPEISSEVKLPQKFLAKICQSLVRSGIVRSYRGIRGGFRINQPKETITLRQIIECVQGPIHFVDYLNDNIEYAKPVAHKLKIICHQIEGFCQSKLEGTTLADLV